MGQARVLGYVISPNPSLEKRRILIWDEPDYHRWFDRLTMNGTINHPFTLRLSKGELWVSQQAIRNITK